MMTFSTYVSTPRLELANTDTDIQAKFVQASKMAGDEFENRLDYYAHAWLPARDVVLEAVNKRFEVDPSGQILIFNQVRWFLFPHGDVSDGS